MVALRGNSPSASAGMLGRSSKRARSMLPRPVCTRQASALDLETGEEIWKSTQEYPVLGIYKYPAIASTPLVLEDRIVLRDVNSHWGNDSQAKYLHYIDKATGEALDRKYAGHVDYRARYASVATNGRVMVYPFAVQDIYRAPAICQNFNRLICADLDNDSWLWDFNVGDIDALA